ncbi:hypothetical protein [Tsukamurella pseudospumae]|uniref:Uncharacterized protein n=1 Tax=Tsukamurella pseudospumae TaxID=239498 RepID=A0A138AUE4_9ACTN|nr:hypothetical protein [Tsukamurella pseudospumae]KXP14033.1 hypothetical protein AXK60_22525 [Tsukamurella pseudospumae]
MRWPVPRASRGGVTCSRSSPTQLGGQGAWQQWGGWEGDAKHELAGTVEDLGTVELDRRSTATGELEPDPARATWDIASRDYRPGSPPRSKAFKHIN